MTRDHFTSYNFWYILVMNTNIEKSSVDPSKS